MAGKSKKNKKSSKASRAAQQQQVSAKRQISRSSVGGGRAPAPSAGHETPEATAQETAARPEAMAAVSQGPPEPAGQSGSGTRPGAGAGRRYVDVAAVRIQQWLGRTPDLKFRRGASVLLTEATDAGWWKSRLPDGVSLNEEAGSVDGVVSLVVAEGADAGAAARVVADRMREKMPYCPVQAVAGVGETYALAFQEMTRAKQAGDFLLDYPPAPPELVLAKPCDQCRSAAATEKPVKVASDEDPSTLCRECLDRFDAAGRSGGSLRQTPRPERKMRDALAQAGTAGTDFCDTFQELAAAGRRSPDDAPTQIAVIYADGNRVGGFLRAAATIPGGPDKSKIAVLIEETTLGALAAAVTDRFAGWNKVPVLAHIAGGDDLMVSVPAPDAWLFTRVLLNEFDRRVRDAAREQEWPQGLRDQLPSLSAGIVFHHFKDPFSDAVRLAEERLKDAKKVHRGTAAVGFLDLTADGGEPPEDREPPTLEYLNTQADPLTRVAGLPQSRRASLLDLYRDPEGAGDFVSRLTDFDDNQPLWEIATENKDAGPAEVRKALAVTGGRGTVRRALDIARYWTFEPRTEPEEKNA